MYIVIHSNIMYMNVRLLLFIVDKISIDIISEINRRNKKNVQFNQMKKDKNNISITPPPQETDNSQKISTLLGLSADNNEEHILGTDVPIVNVNNDLSGVEAKLAQIAETQDKIYI